MKFSVVIPLYNKEHYIEKTIKSILSQTFKDYEIIIVNDGSTDNSLEVIKKFKSNNIKIIEQKNFGAAVARNTGIKNASADYIAFLDADDEWYPNHLEVLNNLTQKYSQCNIFVTAYRVSLGNNRYNYSAKIVDGDICLNSYWETYKYAYDIVWTSATVIRKSSIIEVGMFTPGETIGQDLDLWARVAKDNPQIAYSSIVTVDYNRDAENNARTRIKIAYPKAFLAVLDNEIANTKWNKMERYLMIKKYNKKMIVYIFTTILNGNKKDARDIIKKWNSKYPNKYALLLYVATFTPNLINKFIYRIRMSIF